jgi:hypothetical protein
MQVNRMVQMNNNHSVLDGGVKRKVYSGSSRSGLIGGSTNNA